MSKLRDFAVNAGILTVTSLSLGAVGVLYNAWLTRNLGSAGMGLFSLMMAVYRFAVTFACSGSGLAATRLVAEETARKNGAGAAKAMKFTLFYSLIFGAGAGLLMFLTSDFAAKVMVGDIRAAAPFRVMAFSLPFVGVSAAFTGYFTAVTRVAPSSASQIFEQLSQMAFTIFVFALLKPGDIGFACVLVAAGTTVSEGCSFTLNLILYKRDRRHYPFVGGTGVKVPEMWQRLLAIALPVGASAVLRSALSTIKHLLVPVSFQKSGMDSETALSQYGIVGGMVLPVLLFPSAFLLGFSNLLVPEVTTYKELGKSGKIEFIISYVFRVTLMFASGVAAVLMCWAKEFAVTLYNEPAAGPAITALAPTVMVMYLDSAVDGILKGLGEQVAVVRYNVYDAIICLVMVLTVVPRWGTVGYLATIAVSEIFNMAISASRLVYVTGFRVNMVRWALVPVLGAAVSTLFAKAVLRLAGISAFGSVGLIVGVVIMIIAYYAVLRASRCITKSDIAFARRIFVK